MKKFLAFTWIAIWIVSVIAYFTTEHKDLSLTIIVVSAGVVCLLPNPFSK